MVLIISYISNSPLLQSVFIIDDVIDGLLLCGGFYINVDITVI